MNRSMLEIARQAAAAGGEIARKHFHEGVAIESKAISNLVTVADVEAEHAIAAVLQREVPGQAILGEEAHNQVSTSAEHLWIVDPIDGTNNFAHQIPHFAVSLAYYHQGVAQCGVVYNPIREEWFTAERGGGAYFNGRRVQVTPREQLNEVLVGVGFYYDRGAMMEATLRAIRELFAAAIHGVRRFGTASLDLVHVGCGNYGAYFEYELAPWDFAAGRLFVEEAGGKVTTARGEPLPLARTSLLASNGHLHEAMLRITASHHPE